MWNGVIRLVAIHNRVLTPAQIQQNYDAGVGEKFFLMFSVEHLTNINDSFVVFEAAQFDSYGYLFREPFFISLDGTAQPAGLNIRGMRVGLNGAEARVGQAFSYLDTQITSTLVLGRDGPNAAESRHRAAAREGPRRGRVLPDVRHARLEYLQPAAAARPAGVDAAGPGPGVADRRAHVRRDQRDDGRAHGREPKRSRRSRRVRRGAAIDAGDPVDRSVRVVASGRDRLARDRVLPRAHGGLRRFALRRSRASTSTQRRQPRSPTRTRCSIRC